jgi:DNA-binding response OmpR family regulator
MDGWDVLRAINVDPEMSSIPVVVVSVLDERVKGLSLGAAEYLVKPTSRDDVMAALARVRVVPPAGAGGQEQRSEHP